MAITKYQNLYNYLEQHLELNSGKFDFIKNGCDNFYDESDFDIDERTSEKRLQEIITEHSNIMRARRLKNNYNFKHIRARDKDFCSTVENFIIKAHPNARILVTGFFHYPKNGYMGWHTNSDGAGRRTYLSYADEDNKSFFRYLDNNTGEIVTKWEKKGWNENTFEIPSTDLYWHCVGSKCNRVSLGFNVEPM